jgi:transcriptional regulator with XRE-family HTH domain
MTGSQLRRIRTRLKLTQVELAEKIGVHANSVARWERDEVGISEPVARLVRVLARQIPRQQEG